MLGVLLCSQLNMATAAATQQEKVLGEKELTMERQKQEIESLSRNLTLKQEEVGVWEYVCDVEGRREGGCCIAVLGAYWFGGVVCVCTDIKFRHFSESTKSGVDHLYLQWSLLGWAV